MRYTEKNIRELTQSYKETLQRQQSLTNALFILRDKLKRAEASENISYGVLLRRKLLYMSVENALAIFPMDRTSVLSFDEIAQININLHAFLINVYGALDNLAWVIAHELCTSADGIEVKIDKHKVSLFNDKIQERMPPSFVEYLNSKQLREWYDKYAKNYRDALAHRIPPFIQHRTVNSNEHQEYDLLMLKHQKNLADQKYTEARYVLGELQLIGKPCYFMTHSQLENSKKI